MWWLLLPICRFFLIALCVCHMCHMLPLIDGLIGPVNSSLYDQSGYFNDKRFLYHVIYSSVYFYNGTGIRVYDRVSPEAGSFYSRKS